jgi:hypothetical protein
LRPAPDSTISQGVCQIVHGPCGYRGEAGSDPQGYFHDRADSYIPVECGGYPLGGHYPSCGSENKHETAVGSVLESGQDRFEDGCGHCAQDCCGYSS